MKVAEEIDAAASEPLLVFGSLPPAGADLDLLVPAGAQRSLAKALDDAGFTQRGERWARFRACSADVVDLVPAESWKLAPAELERVFAEAREIPGLERLVRPAPAHALLILARRLVHADGTLDAKRRERVDAALLEDPAAWEHARAAAAGWRAVTALAALESAHRTGARISRLRRMRAVADEAGRRAALAELSGRARARRRRGFVVSLSGLDGAGKSTQAEALRDTLGKLGIEAEVVWTSLIAHSSLERLARPVKRLIALLGRGRAVPSEPDDNWSESSPTHPPDHGTLVRRRSRTISFVWTMLACFGIGRWQRRETLPRLRRGRVVICDRYTFDTKVHLRYEYGDRAYRLQMWLMNALSPRPRRAFLLDVDAATAHARKGEYELHQLERRALLYREECLKLGAERIDAERPRFEVCAEIARSVWLASDA